VGNCRPFLAAGYSFPGHEFAGVSFFIPIDFLKLMGMNPRQASVPFW
jgi:hypothetical protein